MKKQKGRTAPAAAVPSAVPLPAAKLSRGEKIFVSAITCAAAFLILFHIGNSYLWSDEAHTALLARTILRHGVPKGTDGLNSYSVDATGSKADMNEKGTWILTPWFPYYLAAPLTALDPEGKEWLLRLPFAFFGIAVVPLTFFLARRFFGPRAAAVAAVFLVLYVPFLLYSRQCRYYAPAMFFSTWLLLAYDKCLKGEKDYLWHFLVSQFLLFHCNYLIWAGMCAGITLHFLLFSFDKKRFESLAFLAVYAVMFHLPWMLMFSKKSGGDISGPEKYFRNARNFLIGFNNNMTPFLLVAVFIAVVWLHKKGGPLLKRGDLKYSTPVNRGFLLAVLLAVNIAASCLATGYFFRYLVGVIPAAVCLNAVMVLAVYDYQKVLGALVGALAVFTNLLSYPIQAALPLTTWDAKPRVRSLIAEYFYEITHEYRGPIRGIVEYLRAHAKPGEKVAMAYGEAPVAYYLPRLRVIGALAGEDWRAEQVEKSDWIIPRRYTMISMKSFNEYLAKRVNMAEYEKTEIDYPDYTFENIPEPEMHLFRTADKPRVVILKRRGG